MKIIQSFWSQNLEDPLAENYGWLSEAHNWLSWILSANQLAKFYKVELYTDQKGYEILIDKLQLPYHKVHVVLDELNHYHKSLWAMPKIKTYSLQNEPFLHVDGDVFIWKEFSEELLSGDFIAQNLEITTEYYEEMWKDIYPNLSYVPNEMKNYINNSSNYAYNMGIIGGNNYEYFKKYAAVSSAFVDNNRPVWNFINGFNFNIFFEQVLFYNMVNETSEKVNCLFPDTPNDSSYIGFGDFDKVPNQKTYLHLLGTYKKSTRICSNLETYVIKEYPEYFERLRKLFPDYFSSYQMSFDKSKNQELKNDFKLKNGLRNNQSISSEYIIGRNFMSLEFPQEFDQLIADNKPFELFKLTEAEIKDFFNEQLNQEVRSVIVPELGHRISQLSIDEIDELILQELEYPTLYTDFVLTMENYLEEDIDEEGKVNFIELIQNRTRFFIVEKVLFLKVKIDETELITVR
ncbi:DUF6734 family protein [Flavobacterium sp. UW10123]|uniref:DUF6734 family protein n=1 Tax=Flavobacterium sp. UW10123 TaxID=3230800 RepID=UPI0033937CA0